MFSGFDSLAEGFKRFSLDALQQEENDGDNGNLRQEGTTEAVSPAPRPLPVPALQPVPENPAPEVPPGLNHHEEESDEWDWDAQSCKPASGVALRGRKRASARKERQDDEAPAPILPVFPSNKLSIGSVPAPSKDNCDAVPAEDDAGISVETNHASNPEEGKTTLNDAASGEVQALGKPDRGREAMVDDGSAEVATARRDVDEHMHTGASEEEENLASAAVQQTAPSNTMVLRQCSTCDETTDEIANDGGESGPAPAGAALSKDDQRPQYREAALVVEAAAQIGGEGGSPEAQNADCVDRRLGGENEGMAEVEEEPVERNNAGEEVRRAEAATSNAQALKDAQEELVLAKNTMSGLQGALAESQSEVHALRDMLSTQQDTTRRQAEKLVSLSDEVGAARMGFKESNEAHQRTAERSHAFEQELDLTRRTAHELRAEAAALREQVHVAVEDRHALEAQLRQLQAGLTEGQEAARQEGRQEVERLETRLKELVKNRERKHAELELQTARHRETKEMARDLEAQLAAVDRIAQEREVELNNLRDEITSLRKNTGDAKEEKNTWATKYEALDRNFKQLRGQGKRSESEVQGLRETIARVEAEKVVLAAQVEEEGAERVTVVASITHERDFLLRQVDRLEKEVSDLRRSHEKQAATAAARAQTTGALEEYRTRAQQALKLANEITGQTAFENKRLQAGMAELSAEVAQQRPLWERSKQLEEVHLAEVAELNNRLTSAGVERDNAVTTVASLQAQLAQEEEERSGTQASVMRLEAQGKSLKQELQRQQKVLAAARERETTLQTRLSETSSALQAAEDSQRQQSVREGIDMNLVTGKHPPSPLPAPMSPAFGWSDEKHTPQNGINAEAAGAAWRERRRNMGGSFNSTHSDGESVDAQPGGVAEQLFYVQQLRERMAKEQAEMRDLISELEASRTAADAQATKQTQLEKKLEAALLDKKRLQELDSGRNAAINLEYLKNCVVGCLRTSEPSEHARLLPVITTILKLSKEEADVIARNISARAQHEGSFGGSLPPPVTGNGTGSGRAWWGGKPSGR